MGSGTQLIVSGPLEQADRQAVGRSATELEAAVPFKQVFQETKPHVILNTTLTAN